MRRLDIALHVIAAVATAVLYFTVPVAKDMAPVAALPIAEPAHSLRVIPVPQGYVRDGWRYRGSDDDAPFLMDRGWFYEGTIQEKA